MIFILLFARNSSLRIERVTKFKMGETERESKKLSFAITRNIAGKYTLSALKMRVCQIFLGRIQRRKKM